MRVKRGKGGAETNKEGGGGTTLSTFASDTAGQLDVLGHNCDALGVDRAQVGVFKQTDQVGFAGFLQGSFKRNG